MPFVTCVDPLESADIRCLYTWGAQRGRKTGSNRASAHMPWRRKRTSVSSAWSQGVRPRRLLATRPFVEKECGALLEWARALKPPILRSTSTSSAAHSSLGPVWGWHTRRHRQPSAADGVALELGPPPIGLERVPSATREGRTVAVLRRHGAVIRFAGMAISHRRPVVTGMALQRTKRSIWARSLGTQSRIEAFGFLVNQRSRIRLPMVCLKTQTCPRGSRRSPARRAARTSQLRPKGSASSGFQSSPRVFSRPPSGIPGPRTYRGRRGAQPPPSGTFPWPVPNSSGSQ